MDYLKKANDFFKNDIFATVTTGISIDTVSPGYAECSLDITQEHMNAAGTVMGGAIFTLADFAFAVAANTDGASAQTLTSQISFMNRVKGKKLFAVAEAVKDGRSVCFYRVSVKDDLNTDVAVVSVTGFKRETVK